MARKSFLLIALILVAAIPAMAARPLVEPLVNPTIELYQAYPCACGTAGPECGAQDYAGYGGFQGGTISAVPGILSIVPGENWANFVAAAQAGVPYTIKNVVLQKETPTIIQCANVFPAHTVYQQGTSNIRLWWPLMYEVPSTTWTLTILYGTSPPWADPANPGEPAYVHTEVWSWHLDASLASMSYLLELFHELPFGRDEVPIISDEVLYPLLQEQLAAIQAAYSSGDLTEAGLLLGEFEMDVMDACIAVSPPAPAPNGITTGIANTRENPACCKIMADAEYVGRELGIFVPQK